MKKIIILMLLIGGHAFAQELIRAEGSDGNFTLGFPSNDSAPADDLFSIDIENKCYPVNLRHVRSGLDSKTDIGMELSLQNELSGKTEDYVIVYPANFSYGPNQPQVQVLCENPKVEGAVGTSFSTSCYLGTDVRAKLNAAQKYGSFCSGSGSTVECHLCTNAMGKKVNDATEIANCKTTAELVWKGCRQEQNDYLGDKTLFDKFTLKGTHFGCKSPKAADDANAIASVKVYKKEGSKLNPVSGASISHYRGQVRVELPDVKLKDDFALKTLEFKDFAKNTTSIQGVRKEYTISQGKRLQVNVDFPGGVRGFCGTYISPLVLFFDDQRPQYSGVSDFMLGNGKLTFWPEKGAAGYFLAIDEKGKKNIAGADQLFGNQVQAENGFEALKKYDKNKDQKIDKKDSIFKKLVLWQDRNGDGKSQKNEVHSLADKKVLSIDLRYIVNKIPFNFDDRAVVKQHGSFQFQDGKEKKEGKVADVWFNEMSLERKISQESH